MTGGGRGGGPAEHPRREREAARLLRNLAVAVAVFVVGALVVVFTSTGGGGDGPARVGPEFGADVGPYVEQRHERLEGMEGRARAVVSFDRYVSAGRASSIVAAPVERWLVAAPGASPRVTDDPQAWRGEFAAAARQEAEEIEALLPTVDDPEFEAQYRSDIDRAREIAEALDAGDPVVFGVVVAAPVATLRRLAGAEGVRMVDPVEPDARGGVRGLRPEERATAGAPPERPLR